MSVVSVVCCQVEVSATNLSLVQRSPTDCGASLCVIQKPWNEEVLAHLGLLRLKKISGGSLVTSSVLVALGSPRRLSFHIQEMTDVILYEFCAHCFT
jgi:hypothetical protein